MQRQDHVLSCVQHNIFGSIGGLAGASATIQVDFRTADGKPLPYATVKGKGPEPEKHPLFTNHDTVMGDVRGCSHHVVSPCSAAAQRLMARVMSGAT